MPQIFLDCDGVMADFDSYAEKIFGCPSRSAEAALGTKRFWCDLAGHDGFFCKLPLMADAMELYTAVKHLSPIILTAVPKSGRDWAEPQKRTWAKEHFPDTKVICCFAEEKRLHMQPGDILIDDWPKYKHLWEEAGGIFILHTSAAQSIAELKELGVLG